MGMGLLCPDYGIARIRGEVELGYEDFSSRSDSLDISKSAFYHKYSLLYSKKGRFGSNDGYDFAVGYEWASLDFSSDYNDRSVDTGLSTGHLLYNVGYGYTSKSLPLKLSLFSRDLSRMNLSSAQLETSENSVVPDSVRDSIAEGGTRISSGATLEFGEISSNPLKSRFPHLTEIPRIFLNYREDYISNLKSLAPVHYRDRRFDAALAKDSLWVTYKRLEHKDYIEREGAPGAAEPVFSGSDEQTIRLGTVTVSEERLWVDLTNWISISADGAMIKRRDNENRIDTYTDYELNLFAIAKRDTWQARTFNSFLRSVDADQQRQETIKIPVYLNGVYGTDTSWQVRFEHKDETDTRIKNDVTDFASVRVETWKRSPFTLTPSFSAEVGDFSGTKQLALQGQVETSSTSRFSNKYAINASYDVKFYKGETATSDSFDQVTQTLFGRAVLKLDNNLVVSADQRLTHNVGSTASTAGNIVAAENFGRGNIGETRNQTASNDYLRSVTSGKVAWTPTARLKVNAQASLDLYDIKDGSFDKILSLSGGIDYTMPKYNIQASGRVAKGVIDNIDTEEIDVTAFARYAPTHNVNNSVRATYTRSNEYGEFTDSTSVRQQFTYAQPSSNFRGKRYEVTQEATFLQSSETQVYAGYRELKQLSLLGKYFFTSSIYASAVSRYSLLGTDGVSEWMGGATLGINYKLLQGSLEYYQGRRTGGGAYENRIERRFAANLKKQF